MTKGVKQLLIGSMAATVLVGVLAILDIVGHGPFSGAMTLDIMFLVSAGLIGYMSFDTYKELS